MAPGLAGQTIERARTLPEERVSLADASGSRVAGGPFPCLSRYPSQRTDPRTKP